MSVADPKEQNKQNQNQKKTFLIAKQQKQKLCKKQSTGSRAAKRIRGEELGDKQEEVRQDRREQTVTGKTGRKEVQVSI